MLLKNKYIILLLIILIISALAVTITVLSRREKPEEKPIDMIENRIKIKLPSSAKIENFTYYKEDDNFKAKISISNESIVNIKSQLNEFFKGTAPSELTNTLPHFKNTCPWWDLDKNSIEEYYRIAVDGKVVQTYTVWAFISKDKNGQHYLYIVY
jgi:hypothetical protein